MWRTWRNFRIRTKMMIGFAGILTVFAVSVAVTWALMRSVTAENGHIINRAIPAQSLCSSLDEAAYELFMAMRALQYVEDDASIEEVRKRREDVQRLMDQITAFAAESPEVQSTAYQVRNVIPHLKEYFNSIEQSTAGIIRKKQADAVIVSSSRAMTEAAGSLQSRLRDHLKNNGQSLAPAVYQRQMAELAWADQIVARIGDGRRLLLHANDTRDMGLSGATVRTIEALHEEITAFVPTITLAGHRSIGEELREDVAVYIGAAKAYIETFGEMSEGHRTRSEVHRTVNAETSSSLRLSEERIMELSETGLSHLNYAIAIMCASTALAILLGLTVAYLISRSIANPLATIVGLAKRAGDGDLTIEKKDFRYTGRDELGLLVDAMSAMIGSQADAMRQVVAVSDSLAGSAGNLSSISEETNASMQEVKASIDQVYSLGEKNGTALKGCNASVEEMSAGADAVAQSATDSAAFIAQTTNASNRAIDTVNRVIDGMHDVDTNAKESENKLKQLVSSVDNVSSFVSVITGIADQTNLLALNAAIEAARAGAVGRGFAVVAEEVRKLAEESAQAARSVDGIIVELQSGAEESIKATTEAGRMLGDTLTQAEQAQKELNEALREMNKANDSIQNIAAVAQQQAASSKEVATAIDSSTRSTMEMVETISNIHRASEETAEAAQGVAEHSEAMNGHAGNLMEVLSHFKLHGHEAMQLKALNAR